VWRKPVDGGRAQFKRGHCAPEVSEVVARPKLTRMMSAPEDQRWREIAKHKWPAGIAEATAVKEARILVRLWLAGMRVFVELQLVRKRKFENKTRTRKPS